MKRGIRKKKKEKQDCGESRAKIFLQNMGQILNIDYAQNIRSENTACLKRQIVNIQKQQNQNVLTYCEMNTLQPESNRIGISLGSSRK